MDYQSCGKMMKITEETKLVKVPAILFFTLEKFLLIVNKVKNVFQKNIVSAIQKNEFVSRSIAEGTEEVMEEVVTDLVKAFNLGLEGLGMTLTENKEEKLDFG